MTPRERDIAEAGQEATRKTAEAGPEAVRRVTEQVATTAKSMADASQQTANAGAETMRRSAEGFSQTLRSGGELGGRIAERSLERFSHLMGLGGEEGQRTIQQSFNSWQAIIESSQRMADAMQSASTEWMSFAQRNFEHNADGLNALMGCRSLHECLALQTELARDNLEGLLQSTKRVSEISMRMADEAVNRMGEASLAPR